MSRLGDLYKAMETLRKEGLSLNEDLERQVSELEEDIIKKEILPIVTETIEPALKQVQRELVLVVDYHPGLPISVSLSRKTNITELIDAKRLEADPEVEHKEFGPRKTKRTQIAPKTGLCIRRKDGSILQEHDAATTFTSAIIEVSNSVASTWFPQQRIKNMVMPNAKLLLVYMSSPIAALRIKRRFWTRSIQP